MTFQVSTLSPKYPYLTLQITRIHTHLVPLDPFGVKASTCCFRGGLADHGLQGNWACFSGLAPKAL